MESKVLSIRFNITDIASCYSILQAGGYITKEHSPATAIRLILQSSIVQQVKLGVIEEVTESQARVMLLASKDESEEIVQPASLIDTLHELHGGGEVPLAGPIGETHVAGKIEQLTNPHAQVLAELDKISEPDIASDVVTISDEVDEEEVIPVDIWSMSGTSLDDLIKIAPQDHIIKTFQEDEKGNPEMRKNFQKCIEIIYSRISEDQWGTDKAQKLINNLFQEAM